jgi:DMSO reductase anchor subunit
MIKFIFQLTMPLFLVFCYILACSYFMFRPIEQVTKKRLITDIILLLMVIITGAVLIYLLMPLVGL